MNAFTQVREYTQRSTATEILRKLGLKPHDYNTFITKDDETGKFLLAHDAAVAHAEALKKPVGKIVKKMDMDAPVDDLDETAALEAAKPAKKKAAKAAEPKAAKRTVTSAALELIRAGKTNAEVWTVLSTEFGLGDDKKSYPAWYRRHLKVKFGEDYSATAGAAAPKAEKKAAAKTAPKAEVAAPVGKTALDRILQKAGRKARK